MDKLSREEVKELVEKISYGMGSDEEVSEWIQKIMDSVPNRNVVEAIMSGPNASIEEILFLLPKLPTAIWKQSCKGIWTPTKAPMTTTNTTMTLTRSSMTPMY